MTRFQARLLKVDGVDTVGIVDTHRERVALLSSVSLEDAETEAQYLERYPTAVGDFIWTTIEKEENA